MDNHRQEHREVSRELNLYLNNPLIGRGLPIWLPDGAVIRAEREKFAAEEAERTGCRRVYSPVLGKRQLYQRSGHWSKFVEDMFSVMSVGGEEYVLRPGNCPHHVLAYAANPHSFRDPPIRFSELGAMFRSELSGVLRPEPGASNQPRRRPRLLQSRPGEDRGSSGPGFDPQLL